MSVRAICGCVFAILLMVAPVPGSGLGAARAQDAPTEAPNDVVRVPNFWDPQSRMERPDPQEVGPIRFLTVDDFPPFSFRDRRGMLIGFNVDLAVEVCRVLKVECAIQFRPFRTLEPALRQGAGDAIIAGLGARSFAANKPKPATKPVADTPAPETEQTDDAAASQAAGTEGSDPAATNADTAAAPADSASADAAPASPAAASTPPAPPPLLFTQPYFKLPARFVTQKDKQFDPNNAEDLFVGVACDSAHKAFMELFFPGIIPICYPDLVTGLTELQAGRIDAIFGDALGLAFWLHGPESKDCCAFASGPFLSDEYFGDGLSVAVRPDAQVTKDALNYAMREVHRSGKYEELYLRYFPIGLF